MKHAILGVGAIGGLMGTALAYLGEDVLLLVRPEKVREYPTTLKLTQPTGLLTAKATPIARLTLPVDVLWIATKTYQLEAALPVVEATPKLIVPLLNGVEHVALLRERFGVDRVVPGTTAVESEQEAPGQFVQRSPIRLNIAASGEPVLGAVVRRLSELGFSCQFIANEKTLMWGKLCFLAPFALATSASGKNLGEILADGGWADKLQTAIAEACVVAKASGAEVDSAKVRAMFDTLPSTMRSSMAKDLAAGRQLELDGIADPILHGGVAHHIAVPVTRQLVEEVRHLRSATGS